MTARRDSSVPFQQRWQYAGRRRIAKVTWLQRHLPWGLWCRLCAWNAQEVVAEIARRSDRPLTFVQIGSCDGKTNDPLHAVVRSARWSGVLVEPMPWLFEQLVANYEGVPGLRFFQVAIGSDEGHMTMYSVDPRPGDPHWVAQLTSFDRDVVMSHAYALPDLENRVFAVEVESKTIQSLIDEAGLATVDLLHIDAEGFDDRIVRGLPLTAAWAPQFIIFEKKHLSRTRHDDLTRHLKAAGYTVVNLSPDELAYRAPPHR